MKERIKKICASLLAAAVMFTYMPVLGLEAYAAETTCHIGDVYYATLQDALDSADTGATIVIDKAEAGAAVVEDVVTIDVAKSGYDIKNVSYDEDICAVTDGTVTSYALHDVPAEEGGVIFNWDTTVVPATATVTFKDANGHTYNGDAEVTADTDDFSALCEEEKTVTYTATYNDEYEESKTVTIGKIGHKYAVVDDADAAAKWWDGKSYNSKGIPVVKNVKVACANEGDAAEQFDATVEFVESVPDKNDAPTCVKNGTVVYNFKVMYNGSAVKNVKAAKAEDQAKDYILSITDTSAPKTGHVVDNAKEPVIEYKAYVTKTVDDKEVFVSAKDSSKTVTAKADAAVEWVTDKTKSAYAQGYDDVLTYQIGWTCKVCGDTFYDEAVEVKPVSTETKFYLEDGTLQADKAGKPITAKNNCTKSSVETGTFADVKVSYNQGAHDQITYKTFEIKTIDKPANTDYEPQHNSAGVTVDVVQPTHTTKGTKSFKCADCGLDVSVELPTEGAHKFVANSKKTVAPTCTEIGYTYEVCEICKAAHLAPVGTDGKEVKDLPADFTVEGAIVSETKPALGHKYVVLNADKDVVWDENFEKDEKGNVTTHCVVNYECSECRDKLTGVEFFSKDGKDTSSEKYNAISSKTAAAKDCTVNDEITFTIDGLKDVNSGKNPSKTYTDTSVIGPHAYTVKAANFSADGKSVNVTVTCGKADKCKGEKEVTFGATSTAGAVDEATGITTYTASITEKDLKKAGIAANEINTEIKNGTKKLYELKGATVTVPNYDNESYEAKKDSDVVVKIGNATIDPKFYEVVWPEVTAPDLKAKLTVKATTFEKDGVSATGESKAVTFEVTEKVDETDDAVVVKVNGKEAKKTSYDFTYKGEDFTLTAETKTKGAVVSYLVDGKAADKAAVKDVKYDEEGNMADYTINYVIRYKDGRVFTSEPYTFFIDRAYVKVIKEDYSKLEGEEDPAIEYNLEQVFGKDDLKLKFEKHSEKAGTYKLKIEWDNDNYYVDYPTAAGNDKDEFLTLQIMTDEEAKAAMAAADEAAKAADEADKAAEEAAKAAEEKAAAADKAMAEAKTAEEKAAAAKLADEAAEAAKTAEEKAAAAKAANDASVEAAKKGYGADSDQAKKAEEKAALAAAAATKAAEAKTAADTKSADYKKANGIGVEKKANPMKVKAKTLKAKRAKKMTFKKAKAFKVTKAKGKVTFKKVKGNKKIVVKKNGKVIVKKGLKKGKTYKVKVKVKAAGNKTYKAKTKTVTLKVKVK